MSGNSHVTVNQILVWKIPLNVYSEVYIDNFRFQLERKYDRQAHNLRDKQCVPLFTKVFNIGLYKIKTVNFKTLKLCLHDSDHLSCNSLLEPVSDSY